MVHLHVRIVGRIPARGERILEPRGKILARRWWKIWIGQVPISRFSTSDDEISPPDFKIRTPLARIRPQIRKCKRTFRINVSALRRKNTKQISRLQRHQYMVPIFTLHKLL